MQQVSEVSWLHNAHRVGARLRELLTGWGIDHATYGPVAAMLFILGLSANNHPTAVAEPAAILRVRLRPAALRTHGDPRAQLEQV